MGCYAADFRSEFWLVTCCKISQQQSDYLTEGTASCSSVQISPVQIFLQSLRGTVSSDFSPRSDCLAVAPRSVQISPVQIVLQSLSGQFRFLPFRTLFAVQSQISPVQIIRRSFRLSQLSSDFGSSGSNSDFSPTPSRSPAPAPHHTRVSRNTDGEEETGTRTFRGLGGCR